MKSTSQGNSPHNSREPISTYVDGMPYEQYTDTDERRIWRQESTDYVHSATKPYLKRLTEFTNKDSNQYYIARALYNCMIEIFPDLLTKDFDSAKKTIIEQLKSGKASKKHNGYDGPTYETLPAINKIADLDIEKYFDQYPEFKEVWNNNANSNMLYKFMKWLIGYVSDYATAIYNRTTYNEVLGFVVENAHYTGNKSSHFDNYGYRVSLRVGGIGIGRSMQAWRHGCTDGTFRAID